MRLQLVHACFLETGILDRIKVVYHLPWTYRAYYIALKMFSQDGICGVQSPLADYRQLPCVKHYG